MPPTFLATAAKLSAGHKSLGLGRGNIPVAPRMSSVVAGDPAAQVKAKDDESDYSTNCALSRHSISLRFNWNALVQITIYYSSLFRCPRNVQTEFREWAEKCGVKKRSAI